jgi:hypothetical protein
VDGESDKIVATSSPLAKGIDQNLAGRMELRDGGVYSEWAVPVLVRGATQVLKLGDSFPITLVFERSGAKTIDVQCGTESNFLDMGMTFEGGDGSSEAKRIIIKGSDNALLQSRNAIEELAIVYWMREHNENLAEIFGHETAASDILVVAKSVDGKEFFFQARYFSGYAFRHLKYRRCYAPAPIHGVAAVECYIRQ